MSDKFNGKYRIPSARLQSWDYAWAASYFITICTHQQERFFGRIVNGKMQLSPVGIIADILWYEIKNKAKNIELGEYVVMPNHIHGILTLSDDATAETEATQSLKSPVNEQNIGQQRFQNIGKNSISSIIGSYKSAVTKHANRLELPFKWQTRFHDHIIRNEKSFHTISEYIINNPSKWEDDKFFKKI